jgi:hypothetical protein
MRNSEVPLTMARTEGLLDILMHSCLIDTFSFR